MAGCGCNNNGGNEPTPDFGLNSQPTHHYPDPVYHQPHPLPGETCPSSHCDHKFEGLQRANGLKVAGLVGKCFRTLAGAVRGFVLNDPDGTTYTTDSIPVKLPSNEAYQKDANGSFIYVNGKPVKIQPPPFTALFGMARGLWREITGREGSRQYPVWDGAQWILSDVPDWGGNRPISEYPEFGLPCGTQLLGIRTSTQPFTDPCGNLGQRQVAMVGRLGYVPGVIGEIKTFAGTPSKIPAGYLYCDGATLSKTTWPELFAVIAYNWGGSGDSFQLPDLRGRFLRGYDDGAGRDSSTSRSVGSYQDDAVIQHQHGAAFQQDDSPSANFQLKLGSAAAPEANQPTVSIYSQGGTLGNEVISATVTGVSLTATITGVTGTDKIATETRPKNAAVLYMIFAGCQTQLPD